MREEGAELVCEMQARPWRGGRRTTGLWSRWGWIRSCALLGVPGTLPAGPGPAPSARYLAHPRGALCLLIDAESLGFVIQQLIVNIPPRGEAVRAWLACSLCGPSRS